MRLIDADKLIERLKRSFYLDERVNIETVTECFLDEKGCAPTVDAVEVVRCKDCEHKSYCYGRTPWGDNWFCADGERKKE